MVYFICSVYIHACTVCYVQICFQLLLVVGIHCYGNCCYHRCCCYIGDGEAAPVTVARVNLPPQGQRLILPHPQPRTHHHLLGLVPVLIPVAPVVTAIPVVMKAPAHQHETLFINYYYVSPLISPFIQH